MTIAETTSTRPYLIRALYEWCTDNGLTPHLAVRVDGSVLVPAEYVKQGEIVLNISFDATSGLKLGDHLIEFKGRFGGVPREIQVPVGQVMAIYARENGQGMSFPIGMLEAHSPLEQSPKNSLDVIEPVSDNSERKSNLTSVLSLSVADAGTVPTPLDTPKTRAPRPKLKSVK